MWIAKNSITNKTYGKAYNSIYDCQSFIDNHLKLLEYEMRRAFSLEEEVINDIDVCLKGKNLVDVMNLRFQLMISGLQDSYQNEQMKLIVQDCFSKKKNERDLDAKLTRLAKTYWLKNNIIRCYNTDQERWADGFDF